MSALVYLAGPITKPDPMSNTNRALHVAEQLIEAGVTPFVPHLTVLWDIASPHHYEFWMQYDFAVIQHCDALYRMDGESPGADREVSLAEGLNLPIFRTVESISDWADSWIAVNA